MSPETQTLEVDFSVEKEFGQEYEPLPERDAEAFETPNEDMLPEAEPNGTLEYANDNAFIFRGQELIEPDGSSFTQKVLASGNIEHAMSHQDVIRQFDEAQKLGFQTRQEVWLPDDKSPDGKTLYQTRMWLNPDGSGGYEIRSIPIPENDDEALSSAERETSNDGVMLGYPYEYLPNRPHLEMMGSAQEQSFAAAETEAQDSAEIVEPIPEEMRAENIVELVEGSAHAGERDQEHAHMLGKLLMDRLPAYDVGEHTVVVLKAAEVAPIVIADEAHVPRAEAAVETVVDRAHIAPTTVPRTKVTERFPADAIVQISKPREVITPTVESAPRHAEMQPDVRVAAERPVTRQEEARKVDMPKLDQKDTPVEQDQKAAAALEKFRRGHEMRLAEYRAPVSHHESEEAVVSTPRSVAETAVIKMLERFAPRAEEETHKETAEQTRENPIATLEIAPEKSVLDIVAESPRPVEVRTDNVLENTAASFEAAASESLARAEIDQVLTAHGLSRTSSVEIAPVNSLESFMSTPSRRPQLADIGNDNQLDIVTKRGPVTMRRAA